MEQNPRETGNPEATGEGAGQNNSGGNDEARSETPQEGSNPQGEGSEGATETTPKDGSEGEAKEANAQGNQQDPDYKKLYGESTRQNQVIMGQVNDLNRQLGELTKEDIPSDEELAKQYPSQWEQLNPFEKDILRRQVATERKMNRVHSTTSNMLNAMEQTKKLEKIVKNDDRLKERENDFYEFASHPSRRNTPAEDLVKAFLFDHTAQAGGQGDGGSPEGTQPQKGGSVLESGTPSGGNPPQTGAGEISDDEAEQIRKTDPKRYNQMIRDGLI